jgi:AcrR family transcriptional regulator
MFTTIVVQRAFYSADGHTVQVPAPNEQRRRLLADTALALLAESGVHGLTHRTVERRAGLPEGTASNYFRSREALLVAAAERVGELHREDMERAAAGRATASVPVEASEPVQPVQPVEPLDAAATEALTVELITGSLLAASTTHRSRYLAVFELRMEGLRRPALAEALTHLVTGSVGFTAGHHAALGLAIPPDRIPLLITLYGGVLFTLVTEPPAHLDESVVRQHAAALVHGVLHVGSAERVAGGQISASSARRPGPPSLLG